MEIIKIHWKSMKNQWKSSKIMIFWRKIKYCKSIPKCFRSTQGIWRDIFLDWEFGQLILGHFLSLFGLIFCDPFTTRQNLFFASFSSAFHVRPQNPLAYTPWKEKSILQNKCSTVFNGVFVNFSWFPSCFGTTFVNFSCVCQLFARGVDDCIFNYVLK